MHSNLDNLEHLMYYVKDKKIHCTDGQYTQSLWLHVPIQCLGLEKGLEHLVTTLNTEMMLNYMFEAANGDYK